MVGENHRAPVLMSLGDDGSQRPCGTQLHINGSRPGNRIMKQGGSPRPGKTIAPALVRMTGCRDDRKWPIPGKCSPIKAIHPNLKQIQAGESISSAADALQAGSFMESSHDKRASCGNQFLDALDLTPLHTEHRLGFLKNMLTV
jgi:hypothetical protein